MFVSLNYLKSLKACEGHVKRFKSLFGEGVELTVERLTWCQSKGLDLDWFGKRVWGPAFTEAIEAEKVAFEAIKPPEADQWELYRASTSTAWKAFKDAHPAWGTYLAAKEQAWGQYQMKVVEVLFNLSQVSPKS